MKMGTRIKRHRGDDSEEKTGAVGEGVVGAV